MLNVLFLDNQNNKDIQISAFYVWRSPVTKTKSIHAQGVDDDFDTQ